MDTGGEVGAVAVLANDGEVEAGVVRLEPDTLLGRVPGQQVHPVAEGDGLPFGLQHPHREEFVLGPLPQKFLNPYGGRGLRVGIVAAVLFGAGYDDAVLTAQDGGDKGVDEHRRVAELPAPARGIPVAELGEFAGLVVVVGGEELVCGQAAFVCRRNPGGCGLGERPPVRHPEVVAVDRLVVRPSPGVDDDVLDAAEQAHGYASADRPRAM
ncbi:hypothetical protein [Streptomyces sp. NPDC056527]|uniref:hypothetical protein n=1 Tax=Streptomyces sp. NPDC056527 TaxID=3345853 RepID=UPI00368A7CD9